jgi:hypothetical protein
MRTLCKILPFAVLKTEPYSYFGDRTYPHFLNRLDWRFRYSQFGDLLAKFAQSKPQLAASQVLSPLKSENDLFLLDLVKFTCLGIGHRRRLELVCNTYFQSQACTWLPQSMALIVGFCTYGFRVVSRNARDMVDRLLSATRSAIPPQKLRVNQRCCCSLFNLHHLLLQSLLSLSLEISCSSQVLLRLLVPAFSRSSQVFQAWLEYALSTGKSFNLYDKDKSRPLFIKV